MGLHRRSPPAGMVPATAATEVVWYMSSEIPIIDVGPALGATAGGLQQVARHLDEVYSTVGFGFVINHGIPPQLIDDLFEASRRFHALPQPDKDAIAINDAHRGYIKMATSAIVTSSVAEVKAPSQSESFMVMHEVPADHPDVLSGTPLAGPNQWPAAVLLRRVPHGTVAKELHPTPRS